MVVEVAIELGGKQFNWIFDWYQTECAAAHINNSAENDSENSQLVWNWPLESIPRQSIQII